MKRKQEQFELDTEITASTAKLAVLMNDGHSAITDAKPKRNCKPLNPNAKCFNIRKNASEPNELFVNDVDAQALANTSQQACGSGPINRPNVGEIQNHEMYMKQESNECVPLSESQDVSLYNLLYKQNQITELLVQQQNFNSLPIREIPMFDGNPLLFQTFIKAFQDCVEESKTNNKGDCLYLQQYTRGQPQELVRSCQHMAPDKGYVRAMELLHDHFGSELKVSAAYVDRLLGWPIVRPEDVRGLQAYSLFLRECCTAMEELEYMKELDMPANMRAVVQKLPYKLRERWRTRASDLLESHKRRACFMDIVLFMEKQVKIVSDHIFGDLQDSDYGKQVKLL